MAVQVNLNNINQLDVTNAQVGDYLVIDTVVSATEATATLVRGGVYEQTFLVAGWVGPDGSGDYAIVITAATHDRGTDPLVGVYSGSAAPFTARTSDITIQVSIATGDVTLIATTPFDGIVRVSRGY